MPSILLQGGPVGAQLLPDEVVNLAGVEAAGRGQVPGRHHDRWLADDPVSAVDDLGELRQRLQAVAGPRLLDVLLGRLDRLGVFLVRLVLLPTGAAGAG